MSAPLRIGVAGALGRMGGVVAELVKERDDMELCGLFDRPGAQGARLQPREAVLAQAEVVVDFTTAAASTELAAACSTIGRPALVIGSTGWTREQEEALEQAAQRLAIVRAGNFSLGVNLLLGLVRQAARALPARGYDVEILEAHHRRKADAPSGTALMLGEAAAQGRGLALDAVSERGRDGLTGPRAPGAIGFASLRGGQIVGEHTLLFTGPDEQIGLSHRAFDRRTFAAGAIRAAHWSRGRPPGLYGMREVLGLA